MIKFQNHQKNTKWKSYFQEFSISLPKKRKVNNKLQKIKKWGGAREALSFFNFLDKLEISRKSIFHFFTFPFFFGICVFL